MERSWGIMGTGGIAAALADAIVAEGDHVVAVSSASLERAQGFARERDIPHAYGSHHELTATPGLDVVYVATTSDRHHLDVQACIDAGLPTLAEKPFALDLPKAAALIAAAQDAGVFVMEAMWMRVQPGFVEVERRIAEGQIGEPRLVSADFGIVAPSDTSRRWMSRELGGGALLDVGIYPLTLAISLLGPPTDIVALGELASTGVDAQVAVALRHATGVSSLSGSFVADAGVEATVAGPDGSLRLHAPFHSTPRVELRRGGAVVESFDVPGADEGYRHEVREVQRCLDAGLTESDRIPAGLTLEVMATMDEIRDAVGVSYD